MSARKTGEATPRLDAGPYSLRLPQATLLVLDGARAGRLVTVEDRALLIGSEASAGLRLDEEGVSRRHAEVASESGQYVLRDLGSMNGTLLNGSRIREALLKPGDEITVGVVHVRFEPSAAELRIPPSRADRFGRLEGKSLVMRQIFGVLERVAASDATLLVHGETGTGKDLVAYAVHAASSRAGQRLVVFDCSAVSPELIGPELFGHEQGAYTGAHRSRQGAFEAANNSTIFLDEIGELPLDLQPKLLRVLEAREVRPLGASRPVPVNVRVIAATHRDLVQMVLAGKFREDLYYRLAVVRMTLPPLRKRPEDIPGLVRALTTDRSVGGRPVRFTAEALAALAAQPWPGNVRELRNVIERSLALAPTETIDLNDLDLSGTVTPPAQRREPVAAPGAGSGPIGGVGFGGSKSLPDRSSPQRKMDLPGEPLSAIDEAEREAIRAALEQAKWNRREAARRLGIHRNTLRAKIEKYGL